MGLALIARDEERNLPALLESIRGAFDQVALVDTGSRDRTVEVFERWADREQREGRLPLGWRVGRHRWQDDFAAARSQADELLDTDWRAWADCDDTIVGAEHLRRLVADADQAGAVALVADYDYAVEPDGAVSCRLRRERCVRAGCGQWVGRVHEAQSVHGPVVHAPRQLVRWVHQKPIEQLRNPGDRNIKLLQSWVRDEPDNVRAVGYLAFELAVRGRWQEADTWFRALWQLDPPWGEERAQHARRWCVVLRALERHSDAERLAVDAHVRVPWWPDSALTLAELHQRRGEPQHQLWWARHAAGDPPDTPLIINPLDYTVHARLLVADALAKLGDVAGAVREGRAAAAATRNPQVHAIVAGWEQQLAAANTLDQVLALARQLAAGDQLDDALRVLDSAPVMVRDDPRLVELRDELAHRRDSAQVPERGVPDDRLGEVAGRLPRARFAVERLREVAAR